MSPRSRQKLRLGWEERRFDRAVGDHELLLVSPGPESPELFMVQQIGRYEFEDSMIGSRKGTRTRVIRGDRLRAEGTGLFRGEWPRIIFVTPNTNDPSEPINQKRNSLGGSRR
jgi:hypothetical protein